MPKEKTSFLFHGQGGFHPDFMLKIMNLDGMRDLFETVDTISIQEIGHGFTQWLSTLDSAAGQSENFQITLEQIGIYVEGYVSAQLLLKRGIVPDILLGHSFGEFAAMAIGGIVTFTDGIRLICARLKALAGLENMGNMAAVSANEKIVAAYISEMSESTLEISVINHDKQTVISGSLGDIEKLKARLAADGHMLTVLSSAYPFHSSKLIPAQDRFTKLIKNITFNTGNIPVYFSDEDRLYNPITQMDVILASHLVHRFDYQQTIQSLRNSGVSRFIECGGSEMLRNILRKILIDDINSIQLKGVEDYLATQNVVQIKPPSFDAASKSKRYINDSIHKTSIEPIAIIGFGAVLPSALDSDKYWYNTEQGISGIFNYEEIDQHFLTDFFSEGKVEKNKTYSRLCGTIDESLLDAAMVEGGHSNAKDYAKIQKMIALATSEALQKGLLKFDSQIFERAVCYFGATADGIKEYDETLVYQQLHDELLAELEPERKKMLVNRLKAYLT